MEKFTDVCCEIIEFPSVQDNKSKIYINNWTMTEVLPELRHQYSQIDKKVDVEIQTQIVSYNKTYLDEHLATWLKNILPLVEAELSEGVTLIDDSYMSNSTIASSDTDVDMSLQSLQGLPEFNVSNRSQSSFDGFRSATTWLLDKISGSPVLIVASNSGDSITAYLLKSQIMTKNKAGFEKQANAKLEGHINILSTNSFNKYLFAGGTIEGEIYLWEYQPLRVAKAAQINLLAVKTTENGIISSMDWVNYRELLTCHDIGIVCHWRFLDDSSEKGITLLKSFSASNNLISRYFVPAVSIVTISPSEFIIGTKTGELLYCSSQNSIKVDSNQDLYDPVIRKLEPHTFGVISLSKLSLNGIESVASCDLNGEVYLHEISNLKDGPTSVIRLPVPFQKQFDFLKDKNTGSKFIEMLQKSITNSK